MIRATALVDAGELQFLDRVGDLLQMLRGQVQIPGRHLQILMAEQKLDGAQVGAGFKQMGRPAVSNQVRAKLSCGCRPSWLLRCRHATRSCRVIGCSRSRCIRDGNR